MIVCHCNLVRAEEIRTEVRLGAVTPEQVAVRCGAGASCGGCSFGVAAVIDDELARAGQAVSLRIA